MTDRTRELVCISCPIGCRLTVVAAGEQITVSGNKCARGEVYGREEMLSPRRIVTATVATDSESARRLPVRTTAPVPKELIDALLNELYTRRVELPVRIGQVLIADLYGTGIDVIATRSIA